MDEHKPPTPSPDNHEQIIAHMRSTGESDRLHNIMTTISRDMHRAFDSVDDGLGPATKSKFTIREVAELTGLKRHTIRDLIARHKIQASNASDGPGMWFIPREEVKKLMPDAQGEGNQPESAGAPTPNLNNNNKI